MGKTNLHELSCGWSSNNQAFGAVLNPYDLRRTPGGSSGGSAAAVAARVVPLAIGEDTYGSIRVPASFCGLAGLRCTYGRYPDGGVMPLGKNKFDQVGPLARVVREHAECSPCLLRECPIDHRCMTRVTPDRVLTVGRELLEHTKACDRAC